MRVFFRFLLWLSITVLSFQGGAAMAFGQPEKAVPETTIMADHQQHQAVDNDDQDHCSEVGSKNVTSSHAKCTACASCCVGASAPPALLPTHHLPLLASSLRAVADTPMTSVVPAALERPPRRLFV